eukprot:Blabericola_migrator_1__1664@NODE_1447_length_4529_cov_32_942178_g915_i2_p2_GENE_NODE_1447_length_4529_cov_32_942178_g915_i2NODE_1447_length_4529_cov_32_942178_g915_i2_p2_ORF_typecomplete_len240_score46_28_NODE_1447_length_4529_cov_32_942178_g915_i229213640
MSGKFSSRLLVTTDKKHVTSSRCRTAFKGILVTLAIRPEPCLEKVVEDVSLEDGDRKRKAMYMVDDLLMTVLDRGHEAPQAMSVEKDYVFAFLYTVFQLDSRGSRPIDEWQDCLKAVASIYTPSPNISEQERMLQEEILLTMPRGDYSAAQRNFLKVALPRMIDPELRKIIDAKLEVLDGTHEGKNLVVAISNPVLQLTHVKRWKLQKQQLVSQTVHHRAFNQAARRKESWMRWFIKGL